MSSGSNCERANINPAGLTEYVEVDKDQKPLVKEDYSMVSDVISDNILVLQDSIPVQGHKEVKCDKTSEAEEMGGVFEPLGYLETLTTFSSESWPFCNFNFRGLGLFCLAVSCSNCKALC